MPPGPKAAEGDLDLSGLRLPEGVSRWHESWLPSMLKLQESGQKKGKVYVDLVVAIMKVLAAHGDVPAGVAPKKKADQTKATDEEDEGEETSDRSKRSKDPLSASKRGGKARRNANILYLTAGWLKGHMGGTRCWSTHTALPLWLCR